MYLTKRFKELYENRELHAIAYGFTNQPSDVEDLVHEAYLRALTHSAHFERRHAKDVEAWAHRVMKNVFLNAERKRRRIDPAATRTLENIPVFPTQEESYHCIEVLNEIERLSPKLKVVVTDHLLGYRGTETAVRLSIPSGRVRRRLHRAREHLAKFQ